MADFPQPASEGGTQAACGSLLRSRGGRLGTASRPVGRKVLAGEVGFAPDRVLIHRLVVLMVTGPRAHT